MIYFLNFSIKLYKINLLDYFTLSKAGKQFFGFVEVGWLFFGWFFFLDFYENGLYFPNAIQLILKD